MLYYMLQGNHWGVVGEERLWKYRIELKIEHFGCDGSVSSQSLRCMMPAKFHNYVTSYTERLLVEAQEINVCLPSSNFGTNMFVQQIADCVCVSKKAREESGVCYLGSLYALAQKMKHTQDAVNCPEEADIAFYSNSVLSTT